MPIIKRKKYEYTVEGKRQLVKDINKIEDKLLSKKHQKDYFKYLDFKMSGDLEDQKEAKNIKTSTRKLILQKDNMQNALNKMDKKEYGIYGYKKTPLMSRPKSKAKRRF